MWLLLAWYKNLDTKTGRPCSKRLSNEHPCLLQFSHFLRHNFTMAKLKQVTILILTITELTMKLNKPSRSQQI